MTAVEYWWKEGVIYQIYPRSFCDSNGDGIGDLRGIETRLDYLAELGVDAIWLSPFYPSPDIDFGYDISDHTAVDPRFGNLADFDQLVSGCHARGIRVILDMVMNHTSDQHAWFQESRASRDNPKRDWYIWRDPAPGGGAPNNWQASFGGKAWEFDPKTGQYYLHSFAIEQPDVNWRNPQLRKAQLDVFRFWLERGVDGFRLDVFNAFFKDGSFRNNPSRFGLRGFDRQKHIYDMNQPEMTGLLQELRSLLDSYPERYAVGETYVSSLDTTLGYVGNDRLHAAFSFDFFNFGFSYPWNPGWLSERIVRREKAFDLAGAWPTTVFGNHDVPRTASRYSRDENDQQARIAMTLLLTLRGTPFMYYGEEIGMREISLERAEIMDPPGKKYWPFYKGRDGCRSPMQWNSEPNGGFSTTRPWLKVHPNTVFRNVAAQQADPNSTWHFTRKLIEARRAQPALRKGELVIIPQSNKGVLAYERKIKGEPAGASRILVYLNFMNKSCSVDLPVNFKTESTIILLNSAGRQKFSSDQNKIELLPYEILLLETRT